MSIALSFFKLGFYLECANSLYDVRAEEALEVDGNSDLVMEEVEVVFSSTDSLRMSANPSEEELSCRQRA